MSDAPERDDAAPEPAEKATLAGPSTQAWKGRAIERLAAVEEVSGVLRHDLRNHLGSLRNAAFFLKRSAKNSELWQKDPRIPEFFQLIDDVIVVMANTVDERLPTKRARAEAAERIPLQACIARAIAELAEESHRVVFEGGAEEIWGDPEDVTLAIRCLLDNAVEATPAPGRVRVALTAEDDRVIIAIDDDGPGIPAEHRDSIMKIFFTTKDRHAGLGLNIARRIAARHGGELVVRRTEPGVEIALTLGRGRARATRDSGAA